MLETLNSGPKKDTTQRVQFGNFDIMNDAEGRPLALGKGTFGRTYQARHRFLDTIVALKIINERYAADPGVRQRFLVEARAVARLSHPHIARLYDFGEVDGVLHYAMEYCGGGSLADHVAKNGPFGVGQVVEVGQQIAGALKCAHGAGFIHRDLKPSNIMLTDAKESLFAKLIDFGLVQPSLPEATRSFGGDQSADGARFLGTPLFASPEQLKEEPMDVRTDLFSLGMTLWYLVLGHAPDGGSSAEIAAKRLSPESYVTQLPAALPSQLRDVLARLLQKDRKNRFASAAEVLAAFNACATPLGLRRARDYTSATEPTEWDEPEPEPAPQQVAKADPAEIRRIEGNLDSEFKIVTRVNDDFTGSNYVAESKAQADALVFLHVLHPALAEDVSAFELLRVHMTQLGTLAIPEILAPRALRAYSDYVSIVIDRPAGSSDLLSILRTERVVHLAEAAPLLESIAAVCDRLAAAGLPGPQLAPAHIFVEWPDDTGQQGGTPGARQLSEAHPKLYPRFLAVSEAPELARLNEPEDASSTMTTDMLGDPSRADNVCEHFGTLLYRIVAGRNCPVAASLSSQAYVAVPGLSEQANRLLSLVIAKQIERASCGQVLREILGAEGIAPRSHPTAGFAVSGSGSTVVPPGATPPLPLRTPSRSATGSTASSSRFRPMPVAPSAPPPVVVPPPLVVPPPHPLEPATNASAASAPAPSEMKSTEAAGALLAEVEEPPAVEALKSIPVAPSATVVPPPLVVPAPPPPEMTSVEAADPLLAEVEEPPAAEALKPLTPARETTPVPSVTIKEPAPKAATPTSKWPTKGETKAQVPPPPPKKSAKKFQPTVAKAPPAETDAKEKKASTEPVTKAAPADLEAVTVLSEKIVAPASSASPSKVTVLPAPIISKPSVVQNVVPWVTRNIRPIGIGIAALFAVSLAYGFIQKKRSPSLTKPSQETSVTQQRQEPAAEPAKDVVPAPVAATNNAEQDKIDADRLLAERTAREEKAADEAKLAAQKAADDAKLLAEQQKVNQPDQTKPAPGLETAANTNTQEAPKTRGTQKQTQKDSQSSGRSRTNTNSQSANRQAPAAPVTRPPPAQRPANNPQRSRSEFGATAPGG